MSTSSRTYADAVNALNSLQSNAAVIEAIRLSGGKNGDAQVVESLEYLKRIGYEASDLNALNAIHITGTKGKGSTSAFTDSILRTLAPQARTGLYTSPHLVAVRERIRINGVPIPEEMFAKYFFEVWDKLEENSALRADPATTPEKPAYFRYMTFMAFHVFLQEKVDATVLEVGVGGTYDSTNIVPQTVVAGVTSLGIDHVFVLGHTIPEIAHQKGGIYKPGVPALAISQPAEGLDVLRARAEELKASSFTVIPQIEELKSIKLGLAGDHQRTNASLAVGLVQAFLASPRLPPAFSSHAIPTHSPTNITNPPALPVDLVAPTPLPKAIVDGLEATTWPGRCQVTKDSRKEGLRWFLDGAHTVESLQCCGTWFAGASMSAASTASSSTSRALIFNCTSGRSGLSLLGTLLTALSSVSTTPFDKVIFCTNTTYSSGASKGDLTSNAVDPNDLAALSTQNELAAAWKTLGSQAEVHVLPSIEDAVNLVREGKGAIDVLVTGSLHLVGGVMAVAEVGL